MRMMMGLAVVGLAAMAGRMAVAAPKVCDVRAYGAKGDGTAKDTVAVQKAIDACSGGGTVTLTAGMYLIGPIVLKSDLTVDLQRGSTLLGSQDLADYPRRMEMKEMWLQPLVSTAGAKNVTIHGGGTLDGNGETWWTMAHAVKDSGIYKGSNQHPRPVLLFLDHSTHVTVEGITVQNSA